MKTTLQVLIIAIIAGAAPAHAATDKPYGMGGCGLGSLVMGKEGNQILAMTTNGTGTQTFAISSGTSNCVDSGVVKKKSEQRAFIELNHHQLANDISKGSGETLASLAVLYGCRDASAFGMALQRNYQEIFPSATPESDRIQSGIHRVINAEMNGNCAG